MADDASPAVDSPATAPPTERAPADVVRYWTDQLGAYDDEFKDWTKRCKKIIRRYRDERQEKQDGTVSGGARFNALWSNVQTLQPAIYIKPPQPVVERRYLDKDPLARTASMTLERACEVQIEVGKLHPAMRKCTLDYLLCGRATLWERYDPTYGEAQDQAEPAPEGEQAAAEPARPVTYEKVCDDYVAWDKFRHSPAATWEDVWWVSKDEMLTRKELRARFKGKDASGKLIADVIPMRANSAAKDDKQDDREKKRRNPRALVVEIWNKRDREVLFIAPDYAAQPLETSPDPLSLDSFWPCPPPLYATLTNDTLVPVPDYAEYQDQAEELDNLTQRIKALTDAIRVNGVYDASIPELKRILAEGAENRMVGVKNWAELVTKGGLAKAMDFIPLKDVVEALIELYNSRDRVKADMAEITGISDIIRGQSQGSQKTATEQRIKGQFASLRLDDRKKEVARFARDAIAIKAEIIAEQFSPEILAEMTGMIAFLTDEITAEQPAAPVPPQMGHNGGPPMMDGAPPLAPGAPAGAMSLPGAAPAPLPPPNPAAMAQERFAKAVELLKNDKMRTFRIDIETDSTIEPDKQAAKEAVTEMTGAVGQLLEKALPLGQAVPELAAPLGQTLLFVLRTFGAGRDVEGLWEDAIEKMQRAAKNPAPKPPSPEQIKAQAEADKMKADAAAVQQKGAQEAEAHRMDMETRTAEAARAQQEHAAKMANMEALHWQAVDKSAVELEKARVELEKLRTPEPEAPAEAEKGPSESIAFKDLPPEGQAQMAAQAGIQLSPEALQQHAENEAKKQADLKAAAKPKAKEPA